MTKANKIILIIASLVWFVAILCLSMPSVLRVLEASDPDGTHEVEYNDYGRSDEDPIVWGFEIEDYMDGDTVMILSVEVTCDTFTKTETTERTEQ